MKYERFVEAFDRENYTMVQGQHRGHHSKAQSMSESEPTQKKQKHESSPLGSSGKSSGACGDDGSHEHASSSQNVHHERPPRPRIPSFKAIGNLVLAMKRFQGGLSAHCAVICCLFVVLVVVQPSSLRSLFKVR